MNGPRAKKQKAGAGVKGPGRQKKQEPEKNDSQGGGLKISQTIVVEWKDGSLRSADILERERIDDDNDKPESYRYYVHFHDFNRRMDDWIDFEKIRKIGPWSPGEKTNSKEKSSKDSNVEGGDPGIRTRGQKRKTDDDEWAEPEHDEHEGMDAASLREHEEVTKVKNIRNIELGRHIMETWYFSPFPKEYYPRGSCDMLYLCEFCLKFFRRRSELLHHISKRTCPPHPPGNEIYRHDGLSMFEVDGAICREYCQNLCYIAKLFLDHKTLYYDVDPFLFYVMCELDDRGFHMVGYFSKEKYSEQGYNLACILTLPCYQRKGYGNFLISFSYELSKKEQKVGSPEKPLSDLGLVSYRSYWSRTLLTLLKDLKVTSLSIMELTKMTSIRTEDIIATLQYLGVIKYWNGSYIICLSPEMVEETLGKLDRHKYKQVDPEKLHWAPLIVDVKRDKWSIKAKKPAAEEG